MTRLEILNYLKMNYNSGRRVLFVHDGPIFFDEANNYYGVQLNEKLKQRISYLGKHVTFLVRTKKIDPKEISKFTKFSDENFSVVAIEDLKSVRSMFKSGQVEQKIREAVQSHDIIVARLPSRNGNIAAVYAKELNKPLLTEFVACTLDAYWYHSFKGKLIAYYYFLKQKKIMKDVQYCIYVTKQFLQGRYPSAGKSINCSNVVINQIDENSLPQRLAKIKAKDKDEPYLLGSIGAVNMVYKGHADVIQALAELKKKGLNFKYKIVGQGDPERLNNIIKQYSVEDRVELVGPLKHAQVFEFLDDIDIYIHPSRTEGLPRSPIEAMSRACPIIASDAGGTPEILNERSMFRNGNVNEIIQRLSQVSKEMLAEEAERCFNLSKDYKEEVLTSRRNKFYDEFLKDHFNN